MCRKIRRNLRRSGREVKRKVSRGKWSSKEYEYNERGREEREIYFQKLAHAIVGADNTEICRESQQARNSSKSCCCSLSAEHTGQANRISTQEATFLLVLR